MIYNYQERITLIDLTHMMSMIDLVAIGKETSQINTRCSLEKESTELIHMNFIIVFYIMVNQVDFD